jgi:LysM repeat protein
MPARRARRTLAILLVLAAVLTAGATSNIRIRSGDTLWEIAKRHHTTMAVLQGLNDLPGNGTLYIGQLLKVPAPPAPKVRTVQKTYTVRPGDTLSGIAKRYGVSVHTIGVRNHLRSRVIVVGRRLAIPVPVKGDANSATMNAGLHIPLRVQRSATQHRMYLAAHRHPSKAAVHRLVYRTAKRVGLDPSLALAVAYHESGFQQRVVSPVDAIGVMQVLPSTGRVLSASYHRKLNLLKAEDNILAGVLLLKQLVRATGRADLALAGYYQGLGSVQAHGMLPQTHAYIRNVTVLRARFRRG